MVRSAVTSLAIRSIAPTSIAPAFSSPSSLASVCNFVTKPVRSPRMSRSVICISLSAASALVSLAIFSSFSCCLPRMSRISFLSASTSSSPLRKFSPRLSSSSSFLSSVSSRANRRASISLASLRRAWSSFFDSSAAFSASSRASSISLLASFLALARSFLAFSSALPSFCFVRTVFAPKPAPIPSRANTIVSIIMHLFFLSVQSSGYAITITSLATVEYFRKSIYTVWILLPKVAVILYK